MRVMEKLMLNGKYKIQKIIIIAGLVSLVVGLAYVYHFDTYNKIQDKRINQIFLMRDIYNNEVTKVNTDYVIVNFWASWCPPCVEETPSLIRFTEKHSKYFTLLALSQDATKKEIEEFIKTFPALKSRYITIIHDSSANVSRSFKVTKLPETFIYSVKQNKYFQLSGATDWDRPELTKAIENYFNLRFQK